MKGLGIAVHLEGGRPVVTGVLAEGTLSQPTAGVVFVHRGDANENVPQQLRAVSDHVETRLGELEPDAVVVHSLDWFPQLRRATAKARYMVEGVIAGISRAHVDETQHLSGREIGVTCGSTKAEVETAAAQLVGDSDKAAGAAALAALTIAN